MYSMHIVPDTDQNIYMYIVYTIVEKNLTVGPDSNRNFDESNRNFLQKVGITIKQVN